MGVTSCIANPASTEAELSWQTVLLVYWPERLQ
jgi:hypothetical protein